MDKIKESDWEAVEGIRRSALERLCRRALEEAQSVASDSSQSWHQRFQDACAVLEGRDQQVRLLVCDLHRANAFVRLAAMMASDLISSEEFSALSEETRTEVNSLIEILYPPAAGKRFHSRFPSETAPTRHQEKTDSKSRICGEVAGADSASS